jgi:hypothetical protein
MSTLEARSLRSGQSEGRARRPGVDRPGESDVVPRGTHRPVQRRPYQRIRIPGGLGGEQHETIEVVGLRFQLQEGVRLLPSFSGLLSRWGDIDVVEHPKRAAQRPKDAWTAATEGMSSLLLYRRGVSTRPLELMVTPQGLSLNVPSCAAAEDLESAVILMAQMGELTGCRILLEEEELSPSQLLQRCNRDWVTKRLHDQAESIADLVAERGVVVMMGPVRPFHLGPRLLSQLRHAQVPEAFADRLVAAMRSTQWLPGNWYTAHVMHVRTPSGRHEFTAAVWGEGVDYIFPTVDYLVLASAGSGRRHLIVPFEVVPRIAGNRCRYLDELQLLVEAIAGSEWRALWHRAEEHQVPLPD